MRSDTGNSMRCELICLAVCEHLEARQMEESKLLRRSAPEIFMLERAGHSIDFV
jgi:hypothetical protein